MSQVTTLIPNNNEDATDVVITQKDATDVVVAKLNSVKITQGSDYTPEVSHNKALVSRNDTLLNRKIEDTTKTTDVVTILPDSEWKKAP